MTAAEILEILKSDDLLGAGQRADALRKQMHPEQVVSYSLEKDHNTAVLTLTAESTLEERCQLLERLRHDQEQTQQFTAFAIDLAGPKEATAWEYLKMLAAARTYLDNIHHAQVRVANLDTKLAQVALRFGGDDLGAVRDGSGRRKGKVTEEEVRCLIRDAGFRPRRRDSTFRTYFLY